MPRLPSSLLLPFACAAVVSAAEPTEDGGERHGMDVLQAVKTVQQWASPGTSDPNKPWADDLAGLTDAEPRIHSRAIRNLVIAGARNPAVITDLETLAGDRDWRLRLRLVQVLDGIGGPAATPLLLRLSEDRDPRVVELAALGLGHGAGEPARQRLLALLVSADSRWRQAAAASLGALGDLAAIEALTDDGRDGDDLVRRSMAASLQRLTNRPDAIPRVVELLGRLTDRRRDALLEAVAGIPDRRLSPALAAIATDPRGRDRAASAWTQLVATRSLVLCGDHRAVEALVALADSDADSDVRTSAAEALRAITGYAAAPGKAWRLWLDDNRARLSNLQRRDTLIARLHDPETTTTSAELAPWTPAELMLLVDAVLSEPANRVAAWWPPRALAALRADDHGRWLDPIVERIKGTPTREMDRRLQLIMLLDDLAGAQDLPPLVAVVAELKDRCEKELDVAKKGNARPPNHNAEIALLRQALSRRGVTPDL